MKSSFSKVNLRNNIADALNSYMNTRKNACVVIGVIRRGQKDIFGYGNTLTEYVDENNGNVIFEIGSITKVLTTTLLADMVSNKLIDLDDPIRNLLSDKVNYPEYKEKEITLLNLATHTSGFPRVPNNLKETIMQKNNPYANYTENHMVDFLSKHKVDEEDISVKYEYSTLGMGLLGNILATRLGLDYEEAIAQRICNKLNMPDTKINLSLEQQQRFLIGYTPKGKPASNWDLGAMPGTGALRSTANDLLNFLEANLYPQGEFLEIMNMCHEAKFDTNKENTRVGLGWNISPFIDSDKNMIWHSGATGGFSSFIGLVKETGTGIVVLSNYTISFLSAIAVLPNPIEKIGQQVLELAHDID